MTNRDLRQAVWLTAEQRQTLEKALVALAKKNNDPELFEEAFRQLALLTAETGLPAPAIRVIIVGLRLPPDIRPLYLSEAEIDYLADNSRLPRSFIRILTHEASAFKRSRKKVEEPELPAPKRRGRKKKSDTSNDPR